ncbi:MAG: DNA mismatch repair protein MutS [Eubacterium sp.]|nr:DNA mismatch repair protein MutS [Eubacterium sp.]
MPEKKEKLTPMMQQYADIKKNYSDYILFYRLGDFYEMFDKDALVASKELELTLTQRAGNPMCGVPHHSAEGYIKRLIDKGFKVAVCEQTVDPALAKGLVDRDIVRLVSAGTVIEASMLEEGVNNYIACVYFGESGAGLVFADISTGEVHAFEKANGKKLYDEIVNEFSRYTPAELLFNQEMLSAKQVYDFIRNRFPRCAAELLDEERFEYDEQSVTAQFSGSIAEIGLSDKENAVRALSAMLDYLKKAQRSGAKRFVKLNVHSGQEYMELGFNARRNLELTQTMRSGEKRGSLLWVLDKTVTGMGRRRLRQCIERPLTDAAAIIRRHDAVQALVENSAVLYDIQDDLDKVYDLERLMTRIIYKTASPKDVYALGATCRAIPQLKEDIGRLDAPLINSLNKKISELADIASLTENAIADDPPALTKDGGYIKSGFNEELDRLRTITGGGKDLLEEIERREREQTGIKNLRVGYNRVFGYYIEVSKGNVSMVPDRYVRRQTLTNGERYITDELKKIETEILGANDKILALEAEIFAEVREFIAKQLDKVQLTAESIANLDVLCSYAAVSIENNYTRPAIANGGVIEIKDGRHPVVEKTVNDILFTPNDVYLDGNANRLMIITGPNMSGKSTFMRQVAVITLMAQIGCFVPASYARIGIVDKIFTRVGASDDLSSGQSTFMVEMNEVAEILNDATKNSLVILDEIGRGTSTFDGISIAKAVAEYINSKAIGCKTLFATHYHELISMENEQSGVRNYSVRVKQKGDDIQFLHKIVEGGTDNSYGIQVARLAGLPKKVLDRAKEILAEMEKAPKIQRELELRSGEEAELQIDFEATARQNVINEIKHLDLDDMTPREAYAKLEELKNLLN